MKKPAFLRNLKITQLKLAVAKVLYLAVRIFFCKPRYIVTRQGVRLELDLNEGIDLHLFLFGNFQKHVTDNSLISLPVNGVVLDVGGNAGVMSLIFASKVPYGQVHAFEPTDYAMAKFRRNLEFNPSLQPLITLNQNFVASRESENPGMTAYSSWPVLGKQEKHAIHCGVDKTTPDIPAITLDAYCIRHKLSRVDLVKIDTDGYEMDVLSGASNILKQYRPQVIFEIGGYVMEEYGLSMSTYLQFFREHGYSLYTTKGKRVDEGCYIDIVPVFGTTDLVALPENVGD